MTKNRAKNGSKRRTRQLPASRYKKYMPADLPKEQHAEFLHFMSVFAKTWRTRDGREPGDNIMTVVAFAAVKWAEGMNRITECLEQPVVVKPHEVIADADRRLRRIVFTMQVPAFMVKP